MQALADRSRPQHNQLTCGMSCGRGVVTSNGVRRSKQFGRVAVTHVQGSPKGGGALGTLGVTNTRLVPVPPLDWGTPMIDFRVPLTVTVEPHATPSALALAGAGL